MFNPKAVQLDGSVQLARLNPPDGLGAKCVVATRTSLWYVNWKSNVKIRLHTFHGNRSYQVRINDPNPYANLSLKQSSS